MHRITYRDAFSTWDEALPLGNGHFGMMGYCDEAEGLTFVLNHYDIYYRILPQYARRAPGEQAARYQPWTVGPEEMGQRALAAHADPLHPGHTSYPAVMFPEISTQYGVNRPGAAQVIPGMLRFLTSERPAEVYTELVIEEATIACRLDSLTVGAIIAQEPDVAVFSVHQQPGDLTALLPGMPFSRRLEGEPRLTMLDEHTFVVEACFYPDGEDRTLFPPFRFATVLYLSGAHGKVMPDGRISLQAGAEFTVLATVMSEDDGPDFLLQAQHRLAQAAQNLPQIKKAHRQYWDTFWSASAVHLPDTMLETLWYLHLHALACCSGAGARRFEQGCGLNGLWEVKTPSQWGSMWYWDANIEQAYWPVYTANHPELGRPFLTALQTYIPQAMERAQLVYGSEGIAADYPFDYYHCLWPWCAQFAAWHARYTGDLAFLRTEAYPLYRGIMRFFADILIDEGGTLALFPTVSPEQGPMTRNSTITLACLKFLLHAAIEANEQLGEDPADGQAWREMLAKLPGYPLGEHPEFGLIYKDSEWAPEDLYLAHSSLLMPIYPARELGKQSPQSLRETAISTWRYARHRQGIGTHNFVWLACAAARLGLGAEALAALYDLGLAFQMRANGMFAEETDRWMQNCLVASAPVYCPPLMEAGSGLVAAINEMLLQSAGGTIEVFPALPDGSDAREGGEQRFSQHATCSSGYPLRWEECAFECLLAEGGFQVSARMIGGLVEEVTITSNLGQPLTLVDPFPASAILTVQADGQPIACQRLQGFISLPTETGMTYRFSTMSVTGIVPEREAALPLAFTAPSQRRVFLGKDAHTDFLRALDGMTHDYYAGDQAVSPITRYKFDFTAPDTHKDYTEVLNIQYHACGKQGVDFTPVTVETVYRSGDAFGWLDSHGLAYQDCGEPDVLRRDSIAGTGPAVFRLELTRGTYDLLLVIGAATEPTSTVLQIAGQTWSSSLLSDGQCRIQRLSLLHPHDGPLDLRFSGGDDTPWRLNALLLNWR